MAGGLTVPFCPMGGRDCGPWPGLGVPNLGSRGVRYAPTRKYACRTSQACDVFRFVGRAARSCHVHGTIGRHGYRQEPPHTRRCPLFRFGAHRRRRSMGWMQV